MNVYRKYERSRSGVRREPATVAALLSGLVFPGVGQFYNRTFGRGVGFALIEVACLFGILVPVSRYLVAQIAQTTDVFAPGGIDPARAGIYNGINWTLLWIWFAVYVLNRIGSPVEAYLTRMRAARSR